MALNAAYYSNPVSPRLLGDDDIGSGGDSDGGGDGGNGSELNRTSAFVLFPAVYNDGGVVRSVGYLQTTAASLLADYAAAGFTPEPGFLVNVNGAAVSLVTFMTAVGAYTAPPFGTPETLTTMTKDGKINLVRTLVRFGP